MAAQGLPVPPLLVGLASLIGLYLPIPPMLSVGEASGKGFAEVKNEGRGLGMGMGMGMGRKN